MTVERKKQNFMKYIIQKINKTNMQNQITQKFIDLLGPITEDRLHFGQLGNKAVAGGHDVVEMSKVQRELTEQLLKDHLKVKKVLWMDLPTGLTEDSKKTIVVNSVKLGDEEPSEYEGKTAYVYQIIFTPKMYDPKTIHDAVKDGCTITPMFYNPLTFTPYKKVIIEYTPEYTEEIFTAADMNQHLRDKLEQILTNPDDYTPKGMRGVMIRMAVV
jgi:hypothetical protein